MYLLKEIRSQFTHVHDLNRRITSNTVEVFVVEFLFSTIRKAEHARQPCGNVGNE